MTSLLTKAKNAVTGKAAEVTRVVPEAERALIKHKLDPKVDQSLQWFELDREFTTYVENHYEGEETPIMALAIKKRTEFHKETWEGELLVTLEHIDKVLLGHGLRRNYSISPTIIYTWGVGFLKFTKDKAIRNRYRIKIVTSNKIATQPIVDAIGTWINVSAPPPAPPTVFALTSPSSGYFHVVPMASMVQQLQRDNYSAAVNKAYDRMVKELNGDKPYARLAVIEGPTGTGKTHVMTSLVAALNKQRCIYVPSTLVGDLDTPAFMRCMIDQKSASSGIVLLIEDGDLCLRDRVKFPEGVAKLTSMLNLTDGFLAKALDLRVIITTNLPYEDMDDAIKRDGRLFTHMKIDNLDADRALEVYRRLNKGATTEAFKPGETYPLSAVYAQSRK